jgi:hypothetical protein
MCKKKRDYGTVGEEMYRQGNVIGIVQIITLVIFFAVIGCALYFFIPR